MADSTHPAKSGAIWLRYLVGGLFLIALLVDSEKTTIATIDLATTVGGGVLSGIEATIDLEQVGGLADGTSNEDPLPSDQAPNQECHALDFKCRRQP